MINAKLLQLVVNASNDGIVVAEQEGDDNILIYANAAFERLTGYNSDDILYQDCRFLQGSDRDQEGLLEVRRAIREKRPCRVVLRNYRKDGSLFVHAVDPSQGEVALPVEFAEGTAVHWLGADGSAQAEVLAATPSAGARLVIPESLRGSAVAVAALADPLA